MRSIRKCGALAITAAVALTLAASGGGSTGSGTSAPGPRTHTWWDNRTPNPVNGRWQKVAAAYHAAHPNVTLQIDPIQNEQFTTKMPLALNGNNPPDIYQQWGGGQEATQIKSGKVANLTPYTKSWISEIGAAAQGWQVAGQQYGVPYDLHTVGFWYRKDLFARAGISGPPATMTQLTADVVKLKTAHIAPIAVGSKDKWPDAFWWEYLAVRECSTTVLQQAMKAINLDASCFVKAGQDLKSFMAVHPFQQGFLGTPAQTGAGSSAGMVANGQAAMELQGDWEPGVMTALTADKKLTSQLGWFPFPTVTGGAGQPTALLGGGDGFSCTVPAPEPACANFLKYVDSAAVQKELVPDNAGLPANSDASAGLTDPTLKQILAYSHTAPFVQTYFDTAFPTSVGVALDGAIASFFAGQGTPQSIIQLTDQSAQNQ
jgi:raffinose/stachyose/melibiose transport system substrate-binding protein